jgi:hypothetical protein
MPDKSLPENLISYFAASCLFDMIMANILKSMAKIPRKFPRLDLEKKFR